MIDHEHNRIVRATHVIETKLFDLKADLQSVDLTDFTKEQYNDIVDRVKMMKEQIHTIDNILNVQELRRVYYGD